MVHFTPIPKDTLRVEVVRKLHIPTPQIIKVKAEMGSVILFVGRKRVELSTTTAHKIGLDMARMVPKLAPDELIMITINTERLELLPSDAKRVSTALLLRADDADDYQLGVRNGRN